MPDRPATPTYRFWGSRKPPKDRTEFFAVALAASDAAPDAAPTPAVATLRIYGPIDSWGGYWGVSAKDVSAALDALGQDVGEIRVRINSPGGEAWEGMAILNMLRAHPAKVVAVIDGVAASAASVVAVGCDETVMSPGTQLMIHDASGFCMGQSKDMRKTSEMLDSVSDSLAAIYAEATGGTVADWRAAMVEETWYTADEAVSAGLSDRVAVVPDAGPTSTAGGEDAEPDETGDVPVEDMFDLSIYNHAGRSHAPAPKPPFASASGSVTTPEGGSAVAFTDEQITDMRRKLGIAEDSDEATILAALDEALAERAEPTPVDSTTATIPEGHVVIPEARLRDLEANATAGAQAAVSLRGKEREEFLDSVRTKFAPANRAAWAKEYDRDPAGTKAHFASAPDIIALAPIGSGDNDRDASEDDYYYALFPDEQKVG